MKVWQDYVFGGTKAFQALVAAVIIAWGYGGLTVATKAENFFLFVGGELACAGIYSFFRNQHHKMKNGDVNGGKK